MIGQVLGHYRIVEKLGEGGMGAVYRAHDEVLHRDVALKVLVKSAAVDSAAKENLLHEARASSALSHPNICTIHEVSEAGGYIVMELVHGKPLNELAGSAGLPVESILRYGVQIARALAHSHDRNIIHHDLKGSNIVVTPEGLVKILDFGLARRAPVKGIDDATHSIEKPDSAQRISGTLAYMAPEVLRGEEGGLPQRSCGRWAWSCTKLPPGTGHFRGGPVSKSAQPYWQETPPALPSRIPPGLRAIIQRCLAKPPAQRYQRAGEVQAALEALQSAAIATPAGPPLDQIALGTTVLRGMRHLVVKSGSVLLLVGTTKGAFLLRSNTQRSKWEVAGPYFHGQSVYAMAYDGREGRHRLWASTQSQLWGTFLRSSDDFGKSWTNPQEAKIRFPVDSGTALKNIWQICLGRPEEPDVMYCGVEPAALFESRDAGESWSLNRGLFDHPHRPRWNPGNGGLCLHTVIPDPTNPDRMVVAISSGGVYVTDDGGLTWQARNRGIRVVFMPEKYPEFGQCVHRIVIHPSHPERLFLQNHWGLYRSDDGAETWRDIANGVPSDFGFAMAMHPHDPDCVYILPVESDEFRCTPDGRLRVYRTRNAGASWEPLMRGLPQKGAYETVLREGMTVDALDPFGIYFGTRSGEIFSSTDEGKTWAKILGGLPSIVCVRAVVAGEPRPARRAPAARGPKKKKPRGKRK